MRTAALAVVLACGTATAAPAKATFSVTGDRVDVTITGGARVPLSDLSLESERGKRVTATSVRDEPLAVAFVIQGTEVMMGNDDMITADDPSRYLGYLKVLNPAFASLKMPAGSQVLVVTYADQTAVRVPLRPLAAIADGALGTQKDYYGKLGSELVAGVEAGLDELRAATPARKVLVVLGDGNDTDNEAAAPKLAALARRASAQDIRLEALVYKSALSSEGDVVRKLGVRADTIASVDGLPAALTSIVARASTTYTASFPIIPGARLLTLRIGTERVDTFRTAIAPETRPGTSAWVQLGMGLVFIAGLTLFLRYGTA